MGGQHPARRASSLSGLPAACAIFSARFACRTAARCCRRHPVMARNPPGPKHRTVHGDVRLHRRDERAVGAGLRVCDFPAGDSLAGTERMRTIALTGLLMTALPDAALAHGGEVHDTVATWTFDPWIVGPLLAVGVPYLFGVCALRRRTGFGRPARVFGAAAFGLGWFTLAGALLSPLHWLGEHLFTFHMIEHE